MRSAAARCLLAFVFASGLSQAWADEIVIGVAAPLSGPSAILGEQIKAGAEAAFTAGIRLEIADDACTAEGGESAARQFVAAKTAIVIGFLCTEAIEAALPILKDASIPVIDVGVRTDSLTDRREKTGWPIYRIAPRSDAERMAAGTILTRLWRSELFAIVDDGTIYGRELAESFRIAAEQLGLKPVFIDNFRPGLENQVGIVGRLRRSGATKVFVGGDRDDIAIMTQDAARLNAGMIFASGENLRAPGDVPLANGTLMIGLPEWSEVSDAGTLAAFREKGIEPDGYTMPAYAAVEIAREAVASGKPISEALQNDEFATVIGTIRFDEKGDVSQNPYRLFRVKGSNFIPVERQ
ncbi:branched-chain amino acid ABC transporter substrate-binding protein [Mesorhizobium sp. SB112]|uniref:branched-chain amino acid ABC transporter substrate-binding protein n=1 Tax=Mesorhizobium sp. SB112 TaxID=3151853 RepID=UPI003264412E